MWEAVASVRVLQAPARHALHLPWVERARGIVLSSGLDMSDLLALVPPSGYIVDFLTPPPTTPLPNFEDELAAVAATNLDQVVKDVNWRPRQPENEWDAATNARRASFAADPGKRLAALVETLRTYWELLIEPEWPRLRALLDADVLFRSRALALGGAHELFAELHPDVFWRDDRIEVHKKYCDMIELQGRGMLLVPCAFAWPSVLVMTTEPWQPTLIYPARGVGTLWQTPDPTPSGLVEVLGRTRASLLSALAGPAATGELADRLGVTASAVSQHLGALRSAGLVATQRAGRRAVHVRTPLADALMTAGEVA